MPLAPLLSSSFYSPSVWTVLYYSSSTTAHQLWVRLHPFSVELDLFDSIKYVLIYAAQSQSFEDPHWLRSPTVQSASPVRPVNTVSAPDHCSHQLPHWHRWTIKHDLKCILESNKMKKPFFKVAIEYLQWSHPLSDETMIPLPVLICSSVITYTTINMSGYTTTLLCVYRY